VGGVSGLVCSSHHHRQHLLELDKREVQGLGFKVQGFGLRLLDFPRDPRRQLRHQHFRQMCQGSGFSDWVWVVAPKQILSVFVMFLSVASVRGRLGTQKSWHLYFDVFHRHIC